MVVQSSLLFGGKGKEEGRGELQYKRQQLRVIPCAAAVVAIAGVRVALRVG